VLIDSPVRPVQMKPAASQTVPPISEEYDEDTDGAENIPETQAGEDAIDDHSDNDDDDLNATTSSSARPARSKGEHNPDAGQKIKKVAKKISATAHANFRRLKIKSKNSKGNGGGRFGNRRR